MRKSSTPSLMASSNSHMYWRTASAVPWNHSLRTLLWLAASTSTKPLLVYAPTLLFCTHTIAGTVEGQVAATDSLAGKAKITDPTGMQLFMCL
jgi:hypothetical protein